MKQQEILFGIHPVWEAIRAGRRTIYGVYVTREKLPERLLGIRDAAAAAGIPIRTVPDSRLELLTRNDHHQGVAAEVSPYEPASMDALEQLLNTLTSPPFLLVTDGILDPRNLGALIRTALAVGVHAVIAPRDRSAPPTPVVSSASAGALEHIRLAQVTNLVRTIEMLKEKGLWLFGLHHESRQDCFTSEFTGPTALVIGGEGKGIRPLVKKACDHLIAIPREGPVTSLNASVAGAVVMYEVFRQRRTGA